jgi:hypothetical protein
MRLITVLRVVLLDSLRKDETAAGTGWACPGRAVDAVLAGEPLLLLVKDL